MTLIQKLERNLQGTYAFTVRYAYHDPEPYHFECAPQTSSFSVTWGPVKSAESLGFQTRVLNQHLPLNPDFLGGSYAL